MSRRYRRQFHEKKKKKKDVLAYSNLYASFSLFFFFTHKEVSSGPNNGMKIDGFNDTIISYIQIGEPMHEGKNFKNYNLVILMRRDDFFFFNFHTMVLSVYFVNAMKKPKVKKKKIFTIMICGSYAAC